MSQQYEYTTHVLRLYFISRPTSNMSQSILFNGLNMRHYWRYHAAFATAMLFCLAFPATAQAEKVKGTIVEQKERVEFFYQDEHKRSMSFDKLEMVYGLWFNVQPKIKPFLFGFYRLPSDV